MSAIALSTEPRVRLPDHTELPATDGSIKQSFNELPQGILLTDSLGPKLKTLHPDGLYCIGHDCGIYWGYTDPPLDGCKAPDWFYVAGRPGLLDGKVRRSYVLWQEIIAPRIILEYASGDGSEERDATPYKGKFWVYEQALRVPYYGIFVVSTGRLEMYHLDSDYVRMEPNEHGRYRIPCLDVELGVWHGTYQCFRGDWLRWWDSNGNMLLIGAETALIQDNVIQKTQLEAEQARAEREQARAEAEQARLRAEQAQVEAEQAHRQSDQNRAEAEQARLRAAMLSERLRAMGIDPDAF